MNLTRRILGTATILAAAASLASADSMTVSGFYTSPQTVTSLSSGSCQGTTNGGAPSNNEANCTLTDWSGSGSNHNQPYASISVAQFDSTLGNLNSISVQFQGAVESTITFTASNDNPTLHVNSYKTSVDLAALALNTTSPYTPYALNGTGSPCLVTLNIDADTNLCRTGGDHTIATIDPGDYNANTVIGPTTYDFFYDSGVQTLASTAGWYASGGGTVIVPVIGLVHTTTDTTGGNFTANQVTEAVANLIVTYNYTPNSGVPEPATLFLMGSALVATGLLRKRVKKS